MTHLTETNIDKGQTVRLTFRTKHDERTIDATVTWAEEGANGGVYFGYLPLPGQADKAGAWGCATLRDEKKPFGLVTAELLRNARSHSKTFHVSQGGHGWMVRHPGYDLMH